MSSTLSEQLGALASSSSSSSSSSSRAAAVTLLYANVHGSIAKSIPLSTMRENAMVAYESLVASSSSSAHCTTAAEELLSARNLTNFERGTATHESNIRMDVELDAFLSWLALHLAAVAASSRDDASATGAGNARYGCAMVIIEYLLRLYELHARPHAARALLTALLPPLATTAAASTSRVSVHSSSSSFFIRAATIIEVAGIGLDNVAPCGCWSFLRPYIIVKTNNGARGGGGGGMTMMNRKILAVQCAKNDAFARQIIIDKLSIMASEYIQQQERQYHYSNNSNTTTVDGASAILSFTASILVESLYIQMKSPNNGGSEGRGGGGGGGGVCESTVRALLPTILDACRHHSRQVVEAVVVGEEGEGKFISNSNSSNNNGNGNNNEDQWKGWGYILLSTIVTTCPSLGHTVKVAMCDAIVDGLVAVKTRGGSSSSSSSKTKTTKSIAFHEASLTTIDNDDEKNDNDDARCGAILTLITVLGTMNTTTTTTTTTTPDDYNDEEFRYYLPLLPHKMRKKSTIIDYLGCELPISTYKRLSKLQYGHVASAISMAMHVVTAEEDDDAKVVMITMDKIAPLVASLIMHALHKLDSESKKMLTTTSTKAKSKNDVVDDDDYNIKCKADRDVLLILGLVRCLYFFTVMLSPISFISSSFIIPSPTHPNLPKTKDSTTIPPVTMEGQSCILGCSNNSPCNILIRSVIAS